jgi:hypothetical protein
MLAPQQPLAGVAALTKESVALMKLAELKLMCAELGLAVTNRRSKAPMQEALRAWIDEHGNDAATLQGPQAAALKVCARALEGGAAASSCSLFIVVHGSASFKPEVFFELDFGLPRLLLCCPVPVLLTDEPVHLQELDERSNRSAEDTAHAHGASCLLRPQELPKSAALGADVQADDNHGPAQVSRSWCARAVAGTKTASGCAVLVSDMTGVPRSSRKTGLACTSVP